MRYSLLIFYLVTRLTLLPLTVAVKEIHLMGLIPMTGDMWPGGGACLPATEMALRHVNAREDILSDYKLNLIWRDTQVIITCIYLTHLVNLTPLNSCNKLNVFAYVSTCMFVFVVVLFHGLIYLSS